MNIGSPTTEKLERSEIERLPGLLDQVNRRESWILIEDSGVPVAVVVSLQDWEQVKQQEREWEEGTRALERFGEAFADVPLAELEDEIAKALTEIRQSAKSERQTA